MEEKKMKEEGSQVLDLEVLKKQYDTLLIQYKQAQADYINYLKTDGDNNAEETKYKTIKGKTFWGSDAISEQSSSDMENCKELCSSNSKCTGATYNKDKNYCWIRTGDGTISDGMENDYAIIKEDISHIKIINGLSERLTTVNDKILKIIQSQKPVYEEEIIQRKEQIKSLSLSYGKLMEERKAIKSKLRKYEDLNQAQTQGEININRHRSVYIFLVIGIAIIIFLFFKLAMNSSTPVPTPQQGGGRSTFILFSAVILTSLLVFTFGSE
jgi:hypothetical protein